MKAFFWSLLLSVLVCNPAWAEKAGAPVYLIKAQQKPIYQQVSLTGTVTSARVARISVEVDGAIQSLSVETGSLVAKDEELLALDSELAELQTQAASSRTERRYTAWQDAKRRLKEASALNTNIAETSVRNLQAEISEDEALLKEARAEQAYQEALLKRHRVVAPFDGVISEKLGELGEWVSTGEAVFELVALNELRLDFKVAEDYLAKINQDASIVYSLNAFPGKVFEAPIGTAVPVSDPIDRTFLLRVPVPNPEGLLIPGLSVSATLRFATGRESVTVPRDATVRTTDGRMIVWTVEQESGSLRAVENVVRTGLMINGDVEILEGIAASDQVVVRGNESLRQDQQVYIADD